MPSELQEFIETRLTRVSKAAYEAVEEVVTEEANTCFDNIKAGTPVQTGSLRDSLEIERIDDSTGSKYGYKIDYKGYNDRGVAYSYIGRSLNKGTSKIPARKHIDKAVRKLKGMDDRINQRFIEKVDKE
ncbi:MAG: HK97 gp10 family phage protein [Bacteroidales bacterium]